MSQLSIFNDKIIIPGLKYIPDYISVAQEQELINIIESQPWSNELRRRVQHYGYKYDYKSRSVNDMSFLGLIPEWLSSLGNRLYEERVFNVMPDQVIINEYLPGQGIAPHIDCIPCFSDTICSLSLGSKCVMDLVKDNSIPILLEPRSLLVLKDDVRYLWQHCIAAIKNDKYNGIIIPRKRRLSLTFRKVIT